MDELLETDFAVAEKDRLYRCLDRILEHKQELFVWLTDHWLEIGVRERDPNALFVIYDPHFDGFRFNLRYQQIRRRMNLSGR